MKASTLILVFVVLFLTLIITVLGSDGTLCNHTGSPQGGCLNTIEMSVSVEVAEAIKAIADEW